MRAITDIFRFETRFQLRSRLFLTLLCFIVFIHFCAARKWGIDIGVGAAKDAEGLAFNSALTVIQNELVLSLFSVFPALALVATAITRDQERRTAELFFTLPISPASYAGGRFAAGLCLALLVSIMGVMASLTSLVAPGVDPMRLMSFAVTPWLYVLLVVALPNMFIVTALIYAAATWARSMAAAYCVALVLPLIPLIGFAHMDRAGFEWLGYADPFGATAIANTTRYWTRSELVAQLPGGVVWLNRLFWLALSGVILIVSVGRYRFSLDRRLWRRIRQPVVGAVVVPQLRRVAAVARFGGLRVFRQFASQLRMDVRAILASPPFYLVLFLIVATCIEEFAAPSALAFNQPQLPLTGRFIGFLDAGLGMQVVLAIVYYAGVLVHRERQYRLAEMVDASPVPIASGLLSKITALVIMVTVLLGGGMLTFVARQIAVGFVPIQPGLYLIGLIVYGFNHYALIIPAVLIHLLFSNRWLGMLMFFGALVVAYSLPALGYENVLYNFRIAPPPYSDMNGFGHFAMRQASLMAYWASLLGLMAIIAMLFMPRGLQEGVRRKLLDARSRSTRLVQLSAGAMLALFGALGGWIYYNTHILNLYVTAHDVEQRAADYEKTYKRYAALRSPVVTDVDVTMEMFPDQRRVESRGTMRVVNNGDSPISVLMVTLNPALQIGKLVIGGGALIERNDRLAVRRFRLARPLQAGAGLDVAWDFTWANRGFVNSVPSNAVAANGINVEASDVLPMFGYDSGQELDDPFARARLGLAPAAPLLPLDDQRARNDTRYQLVPARFRAVIGTSGDQTPLTSGTLKRQWRKGGRNYVRYEGYFPVYLAFASARYAVQRAKVDGVTLELFYDPQHRRAAPVIMDTMKRGLRYYSQQFSPYGLDSFKVFEYPRYSTRVHAIAGAVSYTESAGFTLQHKPGQIDPTTAHELGHMWWGGQVHSPPVQGQEVLNEGLTSYAALMLVEHEQGREAVQPYLDETRDKYIDAYSQVGPLVRPVIRAETSLDTYGKASLVMYTLRDAIGADAVNGALRSFIARYGNRPPPYPTTRELVAELRGVAAPQYQPLITDLFEKITFYDVAVKTAGVRKIGRFYDVTVEIKAAKRYADSEGREVEAPLLAPFDVAVFGAAGGKPLYLAKHWLKTGTQRVTVRVESPPTRIAVDPYGMMIDRRPEDNTLDL